MGHRNDGTTPRVEARGVEGAMVSSRIDTASWRIGGVAMSSLSARDLAAKNFTSSTRCKQQAGRNRAASNLCGSAHVRSIA